MGVLLHEDQFGAFTFTLNVTSCAAATTTIQTYTVRGLLPGDCIFATCPAIGTGLAVVECWCTTRDVLSIKYINPTAGAIDPGNKAFTAFVFRAERALVAAVEA